MYYILLSNSLSLSNTQILPEHTPLYFLLRCYSSDSLYLYFPVPVPESLCLSLYLCSDVGFSFCLSDPTYTSNE